MTNTLGELIGLYARLDAEVDERDVITSRLIDQREECRTAIMRLMVAQGTEKASAAGLTVSTREKFRARYEPDKWPDIVRWAVESGNDHIVQRRLTDAKVLELIDNGVPLPDGLGVEAFTALDVRRTK